MKCLFTSSLDCRNKTKWSSGGRTQLYFIRNSEVGFSNLISLFSSSVDMNPKKTFRQSGSMENLFSDADKKIMFRMKVEIYFMVRQKEKLRFLEGANVIIGKKSR